MNSTSRVTVVMPAHNAAPYICQAIRSVLDQTCTDFELWVLENGSNDGTAQIARSLTDSRLRVFELGPIGFAAALDFGLRQAKTPWLARMDADDICTPDRLEVQLRVASMNPHAVMVGANRAVLSHSGHCIVDASPVQEQRLTLESVAVGRGRTKLRGARYCPDPSMLFSRERALKVGGYDLDFKLADTTLWLRMLRGAHGIEIPDVLYLHRALPFSLNSSHSQGLSVRQKYAPETVAAFQQRYPSAPAQAPGAFAGYWWRMFLYDAIAHDHAAAALSFQEYARHSSRIPRWLARCIPLLRVLGQAARHRAGSHYRHRDDLDQIVRKVSSKPSLSFAPMTSPT